MARHHELQGELRWLPARSGLVESNDKVQGRPGRHSGCRQRAGHTRASRARVEIPLVSRPASLARATSTLVRGSMQTTARQGKLRLGGALLMLALCLAGGEARAEPQATTFKLANGMDVVVIPDHRVPVVTHMVWYRAGAADDPFGTSGIA